jgi:hypothetical protein
VEKRPRSVPQHRRFFAIISAAFQHWPETHERQFSSPDELRRWLTVKAGYRELASEIVLEGVEREIGLAIAEAAFKASGGSAVAEIQGGSLLIFKPRSIAFAKMKHADFCGLSERVEKIIYQETGILAEDLIKEKQA